LPNAKNISITQLCTRVVRAVKHRRMKCSMPPLVPDVFHVSSPPDVPMGVVPGRTIPMCNLVMGRRLRATECFGHKDMDTDFAGLTMRR
jgi:hypothetical protein